MTSVPEQEALEDVTPAQHEKKLQGAMSFCTLAFVSVAAVYALSTFSDQVPSLSPSRSLSRSLHPVQPPCNPVCLRHSGSSGQPCVPLA